MNVKPPVKRLSRAEQQEQTRAALLDAAVELMVERGIDAMSIEDVVARAGYTRGAFYSNFASKDELVFVAFARFYGQIQAAANNAALPASADPGQVAATFRERLSRIISTPGPPASVLLAELCLYAIRNDAARPKLAELHQQQVGPSADYARSLLNVTGGAAAGTSPEDLAHIWQALMVGLDLKARVDPAVDATALLGRAMDLLIAGLVTTERAGEQTGNRRRGRGQ